MNHPHLFLALHPKSARKFSSAQIFCVISKVKGQLEMLLLWQFHLSLVAIHRSTFATGVCCCYDLGEHDDQTMHVSRRSTV
jgi:hypothetical protein